MARALGLAIASLLVLGCAHAGAGTSAGAAERQAVIAANMPELQACWANVADQYPGAAGSLMFTVDLRRNGSVDWVSVDVDEIGAPKLVTCAVRRIKQWQFPEGRKQTIGFGVGFTAP